MFSALDLSRKATAVAMRILGGEKAGDIKTAVNNFVAPKYDWRELQRWNISESRLSPDSTIYFREPTAWEQYSWQIASIVAVILIQAGLISVLLREHGRRQLAEVQARQRMAELAHVNRFSTAGELTASIAHEINQPLGSILTNAEYFACLVVMVGGAGVSSNRSTGTAIALAQPQLRSARSSPCPHPTGRRKKMIWKSIVRPRAIAPASARWSAMSG